MLYIIGQKVLDNSTYFTMQVLTVVKNVFIPLDSMIVYDSSFHTEDNGGPRRVQTFTGAQEGNLIH